MSLPSRGGVLCHFGVPVSHKLTLHLMEQVMKSHGNMIDERPISNFQQS